MSQLNISMKIFEESNLVIGSQESVTPTSTQTPMPTLTPMGSAAKLICPPLLRCGNLIISIIINFIYDRINYLIQPNYRTYSYKRTAKQFRSLQIIASVIFVYFFIKAYVVGTHLNCIDKSMQFKWVPITYAFMQTSRKTFHYHHQISLFLMFFYVP